jgi:hypothetical protein
MGRRSLAVPLGLLFAALPPTVADGAPPDEDEFLPRLGVRLPAEEVQPDPLEGAPRDGELRLIYLHRHGGIYTNGADNSSLNRSIVVRPSVSPADVSPSTLTDDEWDDLVRCMRLQFGRFGVIVTDVDPGDAPHVEAVIVGGRSTEVGVTGAAGVAPSICVVVERAIVWTFQAGSPKNVQGICEVTAQEVGHAYGLEHVMLCEDPMTYQTGCGDKWFQDQYASCGEYDPRPCSCGFGTTQNSVQYLLDVLGPGETIPPEAAITAPPADSEVKPGFTVEAHAEDNYAVVDVELWIDGKLEGTGIKPPFRFKTRRNLPLGARQLEIRAKDPAGNVGVATHAVTILPECQADGECAAGQTCDGHLCVGELGATCAVHADCAEGLSCGLLDGERRCTRSCGASSACPTGFDCVPSGTSSLCWPAAGGGGGWCAVGSAASAPARAGGRTMGGGALLLLAAIALGGAGRRRRRPGR